MLDTNQPEGRKSPSLHMLCSCSPPSAAGCQCASSTRGPGPAQDSLSGDAKTVMLVAASPDAADAGETACSLAFAARVRGVELGAARRQLDAGGDAAALRAELAALRAQARPPPSCRKP